METNNENKNILSEPELRFREELKNCVKRIVDAADAKRANDIVAVHVGDKTIITDWFVFMSGTSPIHVKALSDEIEDCAAEMGLPMRRREGYSEGRWIVPEFLCIFSIRKSASITMLNGCGWMQQPKLFVPKNKTRIR